MKTTKLRERISRKLSIDFKQNHISLVLARFLIWQSHPIGFLSAVFAIAMPLTLGGELLTGQKAKAVGFQVSPETSARIGDLSIPVGDIPVGDNLSANLESSPLDLKSLDLRQQSQLLAEMGEGRRGENGVPNQLIPSSTPNSPNQESSQNPPNNSPSNSPIPASERLQAKTLRLDIAPVGDPRVQADGRSTIRIRGEITDSEGKQVSGDVVVTLTTSAGKFIGADQNLDQPGFQVIARDGEFLATLQSDLKPQQVRVRAAVDKIRQQVTEPLRIGPGANEPFPQQTDTSLIEKLSSQSPLEAYTQIEFATNLRPSLATGIINLRIGAGGTDYYGSFSDFLSPDKIDDGTTVDFKAAVFATGSIGEWLFTGAFNSYRPLNEDCEGRNRLFGTIQFCEQQYPVYGDSSTSTPTTPSIDSFYARFERSPRIPGADPDYIMWGDFNTEEFARASQLFSATSRQLHGLKLNYNLGALQFTGMYANNIEGFQRDTFVPNGTSGNYFLSKRLLVPGSETVYVETEEINRPGTVIERVALYRDRDYEIDYDRGTLIFRRAIQATQLDPFGKTLVRRIVVSYQNEGGEDSSLYAGRLQYNLSQEIDAKSFLAGSYLLEDQGDRQFQLYGADFLLSLGNNAKIVGEFARSNSDLETGRSVSGNAYRLEASARFSDNFFGEAYYRAVEPNFANNATYSFSPGQTRYGASLAARLTQTTTFNVAYDYEENYGIAPSRVVDFFDLFDPRPQARPGEAVNNELQTFRVGLLQKLGTSNHSPEVGLEYVNRRREDRIGNDFDGDASQLVSRLKVPLSESLLFQAQNELNLGDSDPLYPNRTTFGLDWKAYPGVTFRLAHQFFDDSELIRGNSITTLDTLLDHKFSENTILSGRYSVLSAYNGLQGQGAVGLNHKLTLAPGLRASVGYEYVFRNMFNATAAGPRFEQYYAVGQSASSLGLFSGSVYSLGLEYTDNPNFQASARFEYRDGDEGDNTVISAAAAGKLSPALTALVRFQQAGAANVFLPSTTGIDVAGVRFQELGDTSNVKVGLAYRDPTNDKFNALLKYEYRQNYDLTQDSQLTGSTATGHVFSLEGIYAPNWRWEFYGKYALRNGVTFFGGDRFDGTVNLAQMRASYKLGYRNDLAVEGRWIGQNSNNNTDYDEFGLAVETGYYLTPDLRVGLGYAFGSVDDRDFSGYRSEGGLYLNISLKLNELLGGFGLQKPVPKQQQESVVQPVSSVESNPTSSNGTGMIEVLRNVRDRNSNHQNPNHQEIEFAPVTPSSTNPSSPLEGMTTQPTIKPTTLETPAPELLPAGLSAPDSSQPSQQSPQQSPQQLINRLRGGGSPLEGSSSTPASQIPASQAPASASPTSAEQKLPSLELNQESNQESRTEGLISPQNQSENPALTQPIEQPQTGESSNLQPDWMQRLRQSQPKVNLPATGVERSEEPRS